ncbi:MAG: acyl-CoA dehydrogenase family protein [Rhodospirillales bacterium]|nr:acyl-CoA dehydrogenase family protein [Rhodospirillales bacterium]MCW8862440.1 acyl-CoA dehydrogenase family protein [Rhodospirillales bacterium]MCW8970271.1 acyl-CoA dehydrogenase family protein [Rhodospirillales bacterium]
MAKTLVITDLLYTCERALEAVRDTRDSIIRHLETLIVRDGRVDGEQLEKHQFAAHGLSWFATYVEALTQMLEWAKRLDSSDRFGELEQLILQAAYSEYLHQIYGGIPISQGEIVRLADFGIEARERKLLQTPYTTLLREHGFTAECRARIAELIVDGHFGANGLGDETLELVRDQFRKFADDQVAPHAHEWHLKDVLIPMDVVEQMAELGVFGLTIPEEYGGLGMGKMAMCVVTEELSRGYIGVGSLGTRSEIAAELIRLGGTEEQKQSYLPRIASGEILPTAVFTEPNNGSDLAGLRTRAVRDGDTYRITGNKTWITHASRSDVMTLLARTNPDEKGYKGLSMFLAEKPRGTEDDLFPAKGMEGGEIAVLGYRGMKEYELSFDGFEVPAANLLGEKEGEGFKQLMETFESARIQTAARAVGVAQNAMETGLRYAQERSQFGKPIYAFPRVFSKLVWMVVETMVARQLTYFAGREKDSDLRCDIEAGMAKLLAARVAWTNADNALQIHGGNGYAEEYPISRILCDARILNIFEGAAEIQAHVIARGLLSRR